MANEESAQAIMKCPESLWADPLDPFVQYGSLTLSTPVRYPIGYVDFTGNYDYSSVSFLPNIFTMDRLYYTGLVRKDSILFTAKRFHRI